MVMLHFTDDEVWKKVEEDRLREEHLREPFLTAFRALPQEIALREHEDTQETASDCTAIGRFGEGLARGACEVVRFERYLVRQGFYPKVPKDSPLGAEPSDMIS